MRTRISLLLTIAIALAGCVPSINPFYTEKDLAFDATIVGSWRPKDSKESSKEVWAFAKKGEKSYELKQTDEDGLKAVFHAHLFRIKEHTFLDISLSKVEDEIKINAWAGFTLIPGHLLLKVEKSDSVFKIAAMNPDSLKKLLKKNPGLISHRLLDEGNVVLTGSTAELQKFILDHLAEAEFFGGAMEMKRQ